MLKEKHTVNEPRLEHEGTGVLFSPIHALKTLAALWVLIHVICNFMICGKSHINIKISRLFHFLFAFTKEEANCKVAKCVIL